MRKRKAVVFDFDGTLVNSIPIGFVATCKVFRQLGMSEPSFDDYFVKFRPPAGQYYHDRGVQIPDSEIWNIYLQHADHSKVELFPDTMETLRVLAEESTELGIVHIGVLSMQNNTVLRDVLHRHGIGRFFNEIIGETADKAAELRRIAAQNCVELEDVVFVGDFPSDMRDGVKAGVLTIGVTRSVPDTPEMPGISRFLHRELTEAGADHCIATLGGILGVVRNIL